MRVPLPAAMITTSIAAMFPAFVRLRIIAQRLFVALCACGMLAGCSTLQFAYNSAPELTYWWLDGFLDFNAEQKPQVRADLQSAYAWHRGQQLGLYITWLERAQSMAGRNIQAEEVCALYDEALDSLDNVTKELEPRAVRLLLSLDATQVEQLQKQFNKKNRDWRKEWLQGTPDELLDTRTDKGEIAANLEKVYNYFPRLKIRRTSQAAYTSGGEQQMCAIGRALMANPRLVLLDEPSMGLAPQIVEEVFNIVKDLNQKEHVTFLLAEQNTHMALRYADFGYIMESGRIVMDGAAKDLANNEDVKEFYLGMGGGERKSFKDVKSYKRRKRWLA